MIARSTLCGVALLAAVVLTPVAFEPGPASAQQLSILLPNVAPHDVAEIIRDGVAGSTSATVFTVPAGQTLVVTDLLITNDNAFAVCCQRLLRGGIGAATALFTVSPQSVFAHAFSTGVVFTAGQTVVIQNGAVGTTNFYLRGLLVLSP